MWQSPEYEEHENNLFFAGERVSPGQYRQVGGNGREIRLEAEDVLPASLDGRVACYCRVSNTWGQIAQRGSAASVAH